jgi:SnoaL-like domain
MEPSNDLKAFMREWIEKSHYDLARVENSWSDQEGVLCIFTAPREWLEGHQAILDYYRAALPGSGDYQVIVDHLAAYREGSIGWVAARPVFVLPNGNKISTRFTAVLHMEEDGWKFVQYHVSAGVSDEEFIRQAQPG